MIANVTTLLGFLRECVNVLFAVCVLRTFFHSEGRDDASDHKIKCHRKAKQKQKAKKDNGKPRHSLHLR